MLQSTSFEKWMRLWFDSIITFRVPSLLLFHPVVHSAGRLFSEQVARGGKAERGLCCTSSLCLWGEQLSCPGRNWAFFSLLAFFAYDGQRSDFGLSCNVGCSLWARTQWGVEARAVLGKAPLRSLWIARFPMAVTLVTLLWEHRGRSPAS